MRGQDALPEPHLMVSNEGEHFQYSIIHPELARHAWIEVIDRPTVIDEKVVDVQRYGEFDWEWDHKPLNDWEQDEDNLTLSLWDPDGETLTCDGLAISAQRGGEVSRMTVGARKNFEPYPRLAASEVRVAQGSAESSFEVTGSDFTAGAKLHVHSEKAVVCEDRFVHIDVHDLAHARVTVESECFRKPGIFYLSSDSGNDVYGDERVWVHVASKTSPVLRSVSPPKLAADNPQDKLTLVVHGSRFTKDSDVYAGYLPTASLFEQPQVPFDTEYVSPTELRVTVDPQFGSDPLGGKVWPEHDALRLWVKGSDDKFELSEFRDLEVDALPSQVRPRKTAVITSVSPFPVRLMNEFSPEELQITIHGENFVPENKAMAAFGNSANNNLALRTEYVSPTTLHAWIPREYWRKHHIVYQFVVETTAGRQYTTRTELKEDD
jgi:hypothetical protein